MAATTYDDLAGQVMIDTPEAPLPVVISMLNISARYLCVKSSCWNEWQSIPLIEGVSDYLPDAPTSSSVISNIKHVVIGSREVSPATTSDMIGNENWAKTAPGEPRFYNMLADMTIRVYPNPSAAEVGKSILVYCVYSPSIDAISVPAQFIDRYAETLIAGAKYRLMAMPNKPWSDQADAAYYESKFIEGVTNARIEVASDYSTADLTVSAVRFGR